MSGMLPTPTAKSRLFSSPEWKRACAVLVVSAMATALPKKKIEIMCRAMEDMRNQTLKEGMINVAKKMLEDGTITLEKIEEFVGLSVDEVRKLKTDQNM